MILLIIIALLVCIWQYFNLKLDYTTEKRLLLWYTQKKERKYWILW